MMNSNLTLLQLLYYVTISIAADILAVDDTAVLQRWWNKPFKRNRRSSKKHHPQRRSRFLWGTPSLGHKPEKRQPEFRRTRFCYGRGKSRCTRYFSYIIYIYILSCGMIKPVQKGSREESTHAPVLIYQKNIYPSVLKTLVLKPTIVTAVG
jgi:hypothetical protein